MKIILIITLTLFPYLRAFTQECGLPDGEAENRTRYKESVAVANESCKAEVQSRICQNGKWGSWSGTFTQTLCDASKTDEELLEITNAPSNHNGQSFNLKFLMLLTTPVMASMAIEQCSFMQPSVAAFSLGTGTFLLTEANIFGGYKKASDERMAIIKGDKESYQKQYDTLIAAAEQTHEAMEAIKKKKTASTVVQAAYYAAAITAFLEGKNYFQKYGRCHVVDNDIFNPFLNFEENLKALALTLYQEIIPQCHAGFAEDGSKVGIIAGGALVALEKMYKANTAKLSKILSNGNSRAGVFGAYALMATSLAGDYDQIISDLETREDHYRNLADTLRKLSEGVHTSFDGTGALITNKLPPSLTAPTDLSFKTETYCATGKDGQMDITTCKECTTAQNCKKAEIMASKFSQTDLKVPTVLSDTLKLTEQLGNAVYSGNTKDGALASEQLAKNATNLKKLYNQLEKDAEKENVAKGMPKGSLQAEKKATLKLMTEGLQKSLSELDPKQAEEILSYTKTNSTQNQTKKSEPKQESSSLVNTKTSSGHFKFDLTADPTSQERAPASVATESNGTGNESDQVYGSEKKDIDYDGEKNIFKVLTKRYIQSAYPVFLKEKKQENDL